MKLLISCFLAIVLTACTDDSRTLQIAAATVDITNLAENSGGSGTIIFTSSTHSNILTNGHVCKLLHSGGYVHTNYSKYLVKYFKVSTQHDLCIVTVGSNLLHSSPIAENAPAPLDSATTYGHPELLPIIVTEGRFSDKKVINVLTGFRPCNEKEKQDPRFGPFCQIFMVPEIKTYESIVTSTLIQPGSSGSGVYNAYGEVAAVIFAGAGQIGYGFAVPLEYVRSFIYEEYVLLPVFWPNYSMSSADEMDNNKKTDDKTNEEKLKRLCRDDPSFLFCSEFNKTISHNDLIYRK